MFYSYLFSNNHHERPFLFKKISLPLTYGIKTSAIIKFLLIGESFEVI